MIYEGQDLISRSGNNTDFDLYVAIVGTVLMVEATRRSIGWALPILAGIFLAYAFCGPQMPDWAFPHRGYGVDRIAPQLFLKTEGIFSTAMRVMFTYVFLFVVFGAFRSAALHFPPGGWLLSFFPVPRCSFPLVS